MVLSQQILLTGLAGILSLSMIRHTAAQEHSADDAGREFVLDDAGFDAGYEAYPDAILSEPTESWESPPAAACNCQSPCKTACKGVCRDPGFPAKPKRELPGDIDEGDCPSKRYRMDDRLRSGDPNCVYKWAKPSITDKYSAWYVGGGAAFKGRGRTAAEGTWGLDYDGLFGHARTWLNYTCGKRQGGEGAYEGEHVPLKKKFSALH